MKTSKTTGTVSITILDRVATLSFAHPSSNSFPRQLLNQLTAQINDLSTKTAVGVIVLKSEGHGAFCAGASFDELLGVTTPEEGKEFFSGFAHLINAMRLCNKVIIGRIQGKAVGGGVGIIAACDYTFALNCSAIKLSEIAIGIGPFVIEPAVSRKIGTIAMSELALTPQHWKTAQWALQKGLYTEVFDTIEAVDKNLTAFANSLASYNPEALLEMKKVFWKDTNNWNELLIERAQISGQLVLSDFTKKALQAFKK